MRLLLDTHAVLWWLLDDPALTKRSRGAIEAADAQVFVSSISVFEITTKARLGKLLHAQFIADRIEDILPEQQFACLAVEPAHAALAGRLSITHRDPFDRILIAQAMHENMTLVSNERLFDTTGVKRLW